jgi:uncharacterized protein
MRILVATSLLSFSVLVQAASKPDSNATQGIVRREDLEIVDCLLPGQVRQLGSMTYLTPRRPTHTTASDCRIRGGEYVAYDRADLKSALGVWLAAAQGGDAEAQTNVAEIYERGLGGPPDLAAAVLWYQKAADQKYSRALFNLGTLYEQGIGVPQDKLKALNLYRQAWGLPEDSVIYQSAARDEQEALRAELEKQLAEKDGQLQLLQHQLEGLEKQLSSMPAPKPNANTSPQSKPDGSNMDPKAEIEALKKWIAQLESERAASNSRLASLPKLRTPAVTATMPTISAASRRALGRQPQLRPLLRARHRQSALSDHREPGRRRSTTPSAPRTYCATSTDSPCRCSRTRATSACSRRSTTSTTCSNPTIIC